MSGYKRVNFYELCRLCATNQQKEKTHIFQEEGRKIQLQNKIQSCLSLKVCENDFLPKVVCSQCLRTLEECYTFRKECQGSETMLSSYFNNFRHTDDFKKSGKVYIKDTSTKITTVTTAPLTTATNVMSTSQTDAPSSNFVNVVPNPAQESFSFVQQAPNQANVKNCMKTEPKVVQNVSSQPQVAYNLSAVNIEALKSFLQTATKSDAVANVTVNANGEIIGIGPIVNFDNLFSQNSIQKPQRNVIPDNKPVIQGRKRHKVTDLQQKRSDNSYLDDEIIKIDLTKNDASNVEQSNKIAYAFKTNDSFKSPANAAISVPELNPAQLVNKFVNSSHLPSKMADSEPSQTFATNANVGYVSQVNTSSSINVMSNVRLQNVNLNTVGNFNAMNSNSNTNYSHSVNQATSTSSLVQNVTNTTNQLINFHQQQQTNASKIQNVTRKNYSVTSTQNNNGIITNVDLNSHVDSSILEKNAFVPTAMNILNMNITSASANLLSNLNLVPNMNNVTKSENELNATSNSSVLNVATSTMNVHNTPNNVTNEVKVHITSPNMLQAQNVNSTSPPESDPLDVVTNTNATSANANVASIVVTDANLKVHVCEICKKSFKRKEHLFQHVKLHTGFRPFKCDSCNKCFMRKEHLLRHMTAHSGAKNFTCNICEKSFSRNDNLLKHKKTHEKQSSFVCQVCQKQFVMKHYYVAHKLTHETERCNLNQLWGALKA